MEYNIKDRELLKDMVQDAVANYCCDADDQGRFEVIVKINSDLGCVLPVEILSTKNRE